MSAGALLRMRAVLVGITVVLLAGYTARAQAGAAPIAQPQSFTVAATGDVLLHQNGPLIRGAAAAGAAKGIAYDFTPVFADVVGVIRGVDLAICHLETPLAEPGGPFRGYPSFSVQPQIVDALVHAGYDTCSTASNHSLDDGVTGLVRTLDELDARGMGHAGTARSESESLTPSTVDVRGVRVAHLAWTFGLNGISEPRGRPWVVNNFDPAGRQVDVILEDAARARRGGAEVVIASVHCCTEYDHDPDTVQRTIAAALLSSPDVDLVLGHHAHVVQPFERIGSKWVAYGLGNHLAQQRRDDTYDSVIARFTFTRAAGGTFFVTAAEAIPTRIERSADAVRLVQTRPGSASFERVAEALGTRGAVDAGLVIGSR